MTKDQALQKIQSELDKGEFFILLESDVLRAAGMKSLAGSGRLTLSNRPWILKHREYINWSNMLNRKTGVY